MPKSKKVKQNKSKIVKADEVVDFGIFKIARYDNILQFTPSKTPEQHEQLMQAFAEEYPKIIKDIKSLVIEIRDLITLFNPLQLLQCCYYKAGMILVHDINKEISSPVNFTNEENTMLKMLSYTQSILMSDKTLPIKKMFQIEEFDEPNWEILYNKIQKLYNKVNSEYHIANYAYNRDKDDSMSFNEANLYIQAQLIWSNISGKRYFCFESDYLKNLLSQHNDIFIKLFGLSISEFVDGIGKIAESIIFGLGDIFRKTEEMMQRYPDVDPENMPHEAREVATEFHDKFVGFDLFDVQKITGFPNKLLDCLSYGLGEEEFFLAGEYAGTPLNTLSTKKCPFIKIENKYYCFDQNVLFDNLYRNIRRMLIKLEPEYANMWNEKQQKASESYCINLFKNIMPKAKIYRNVFSRTYLKNSTKKDWRENDALIVFDNQLIILEIKAGSFSPTSPTYDFSAFKKSIDTLLAAPVKQGELFLNTLSKDKNIKICDSEHKVVDELNIEAFKNITICSVSLDEFTHFTAKSHLLKPLGYELPDHPVWSLSIDDLLVFSDFFKNNPTQFFHFLSHRTDALKTNAEFDDEIDHLGLYIKYNAYSYMISKEKIKMSFNSFSDQIDNYYQKIVSKNKDHRVEKPSQGIPARIQELINAANYSSERHCVNAISSILNNSGNQRIDFGQKIDYCLKIQRNTNIILPFYADDFTLICIQKSTNYNNINEIDKLRYSNLYIMNSDSAVGIDAYYDSNDKLYDIKFREYKKTDLNPSQLNEIYKYVEYQKERRANNYLINNNIKKIGRNAPCPCGSGKKYKNCCGENK